MDILQSPSPPPRRNTGWAPLALGFRPFFLFAAIASVSLMVAWLVVWHGRLGVPTHYDPVAWHAHEMLFGYAAAVIAGFLLTAVRNWTGLPTWTGAGLAFMVAVWLLGRVLPWIPGVPSIAVVAADIAFLPLLSFSLIRPLWLGQNRVNRVFLLLLPAMALANLLSHLQLLGIVTGLGDARHIMLDLILLLIVLVGGRVLPFFTRSVVTGFEPVTRVWVERMSFGLLLLIIGLDIAGSPPAALRGGLWLIFGGVQFIRLSGWFDRRALGMPVLWVLHAGYAWLGFGAILRGLAVLGAVPALPALHALTVGAVGVFTLGMMARVSRGHTGRPINVSRPTATAFVIINVAAVVRVFGPAVLPGGYELCIDLSAGLWVAAFALFTFRHAVLLMRPRVDGKAG